MKFDIPGSPNSVTSGESDRSGSSSFPDTNLIKRLKKKYSSSEDSESPEDTTEDIRSKLDRKLQGLFPVHEHLIKVQPLLENIATKAIFAQEAEMRANWIGKAAQLARLKDAEIGTDAEGIFTVLKTKQGTLQINRVLGTGNNGVAYSAMDENGNLLVLKAMAMRGAPLRELTARALRESENMNKNAIESKVFFDKNKEQLLVSMPFYAGSSVKDALATLSDKILEAQEQGHSREALVLTANMFKIIAAVLKAIHQFHTNTGLVHADAWVDNFRVIETATGEYEAFVLDYGGCCESGITSDGYFAQHLQEGTGNYHTSPELPNKANCLLVINEKFSELQKELSNKKQQLMHAKNPTEKRAAKSALQQVESEIFKVEAFFRVQKIEQELQRHKYNHPENDSEKCILEKELQDKKAQMIGIEHTLPTIFKSCREYSAEINAKSDLHAIIASSLFEGMINLFPGVWPVQATSDANPETVPNVTADFMRWAMQYGCNSDWFFNSILLDIPQAKDFIDEVVAKRDHEMAVNGWTVSNQARVDIVSAVAMVEMFIARTENILKKSPQVSVATRANAIQDRIHEHI